MNYQEFKSRAFPAHKLALDPFLSRGYRYISLPITWVLYHRDITPNQVSYLQILVGLVGCLVIFAWAGTGGFLIGVFLLHFAYVLDCVDGELARVRNTQSIPGIFLDKYAHAITMQAILVATGVHMAAGFSPFWAGLVLCLSWVASFSTFNPANRLIQTVADALMRRRQHEQYRIETYRTDAGDPLAGQTPGQGPMSRKEALIEDAEKLVGGRAGSLRNTPIFQIAKHSFRHVTYLFGMTVLLIFELLGVPQSIVSGIWCFACLAIIAKEAAFVYLIVNKGLIENRVQVYQDLMNGEEAEEQPGRGV